VPYRCSLAVTFGLVVLPSWGCAYPPPRPEPPTPAQSAPDPNAAALVGQWVGQTEEDGTFTLVFGSNGRFSYSFSGGKKEHGVGRYSVRGSAITILEDGDDDNEAEVWTFTVGNGQLRLRMPNDDEIYSLVRRPN
jgi:hypothetical protein